MKPLSSDNLLSVL